MPRRNGPQARASGFDDLHDRLPRSIALRLTRAGFTPSGALARPPEPPLAADGERGIDHPAASLGPVAR